MASTLEQILDAVEDAIAPIPGLRVKDHNKVGQAANVTGNASEAVVLAPDIGSYRETFGRGTWVLDVEVLFLTSANVDRVGQRRLIAFMSPTGDASVLAAIEADKTLGGVVNQAFLSSFRHLGIEEVAQVGSYGGIATIRITASGV